MNLKSLADKLTTELTGVLQYDVTDDIQLFSEDMKLGDDTYVPVLLSLLSSFENENRYIRTLVYQMKFRVAEADRDSFYADVDTFKAAQTTEVIGSYVVTKVVQNPITVGSIIESGVDYFEYTLEFIWVYSLSKVGTNATITVDTVEIPFTLVDVVHDIGYVSNTAQGSNYRLTNDTVTMEIPLIISNTKVSSLYDDVNSNTYNKVYALNIDGVSKSVVLKKGQYTYSNTSDIVGMILTFETSYPRVVMTLDGDSVPIIAYRYNGKKVMDNAPKNDSDVSKAYSSSKVRTWSITFIKDSSTAWDKMIDDIYGDDIGITYTLIIGSEPFTVELTDGIEQFTETGDIKIDASFAEYGE